MKKIVLLLCVMMLGGISIANAIKSEAKIASSSVCKIEVVDEEGIGIDNVSIQVQNSSLRATTDTDGIALLDCEEDAVFILSHDNYTTTEVSRNNESELRVVMASKDDD